MIGVRRTGFELPRAGCVAALLVLGGCASNPPCHPGERSMLVDTLYFGASHPGGDVTEAQWREFVDGAVTPRFPKGFAWWRGGGQWRGASGEIQREATFILRLVHEEADEAAVLGVADHYKARFRQESVLRVRQAGCVRF